MASTITITIGSNPAAFTKLGFLVVRIPGFSFSIVRTFVTGTPTSALQVQIGADAAETLANVYASFVGYLHPIMVQEIVGSTIEITFTEPGEYTATFVNHPPTGVHDGGGAFTIDSDYEEVAPELEESFDGNVYALQIEVIDTYENEMPLVEQLTQVSAPVLKFDGGDDVFSPIVAGTLDFNMEVADKSDAKFKHLFTGDEKRYLVKLNNVDEEENKTLIWQGYLLPDQYKEPYVTGLFFVSFTATDMIGSLRGKFFDPWIYYQKYTNPEIFSMLFALTGISQDFIVRPSLVNASGELGWANKIVSLEPYVTDGRYTDAYSILEKLLVSQALTLISYRGVWIIEGITRKGEASGEQLRFNAAGEALPTQSFEKVVKPIVLSNGTASVTSITPFKSFELKFDYNKDLNLFPDDVIVRKSHFIEYLEDAYVTTSPATTTFHQWTRVGATNYLFTDPNHQFSYERITSGEISQGEADAVNNYFECKSKPFVSPSRVYELDIELEVTFQWIPIPFSSTYVEEHMNLGDWDYYVPWQLFFNDTEIRSNRPSAPSAAQNVWEREYVYGQFGGHVMRFKLKREFTVGAEGFLSFRFLTPITGYAPDAANLNSMRVVPKVFRVNVVEGDEAESLLATRPVNFTHIKDLTLPITCSVNTSIRNGYSLGARVGAKEVDVPVGTQTAVVIHQIFPPLNDLEMSTKKFVIDPAKFDEIFNRGRSKSLYLAQADGTKVHFVSVYALRENPPGFDYDYYLYYLLDFEGRPFKPKEYIRMPEITGGDALRLVKSDFTEEDFQLREFWKIYGFEDEFTYPKAMAAIYHGMRSVPSLNVEGTVLGLLFPDQVVQFFFDGAAKEFIGTSFTLNLFEGKTTINAKENVFEVLEDITYE